GEMPSPKARSTAISISAVAGLKHAIEPAAPAASTAPSPTKATTSVRLAHVLTTSVNSTPTLSQSCAVRLKRVCVVLRCPMILVLVLVLVLTLLYHVGQATASSPISVPK